MHFLSSRAYFSQVKTSLDLSSLVETSLSSQDEKVTATDTWGGFTPLYGGNSPGPPPELFAL